MLPTPLPRKPMKTLLLAVGFSLLLSGCGGAESDAKKAVLGSLKDPDSAKFGKFTQVNEWVACLTVNARNSMGGYTGDQQATLKQFNKKWVVSSIDEISHDNCISDIRHLDQLSALEQQRNELVKKQAEAQLKRCSEIKDCFEMVVIPAGSFDMGELSLTHKVTLKDFALSKTEVTQGQWRAVMGSNPSKFSNCGDTCPVEQVSWNDVQEFIQQLNTKTGKQYRLPSEAEWEYACYGGRKSEYCGGDSIDAVGWYEENSGKTPHPVAQKQANAFGLYDMSGNVLEWVQDSYHASYDGAPGDGTAWQDEGPTRVLRGGSFTYRDARSAIRIFFSPMYQDYYYGFRVARTLP